MPDQSNGLLPADASGFLPWPTQGPDIMPTKEDILAQPVPTPEPLTPTQQFTQNVLPWMGRAAAATPMGMSISDLVQKLVSGGELSPTGALTLLGQLPVYIHQISGALGRTGAEPSGMYNLGIRSPGERAPGEVLMKPYEVSTPSSGPQLDNWDEFPLVK